jgi:hypothetical protein
MDRFSVHFWTMLKALTVSQAKPKLGRLLDQAGNGRAVFLRRKERLYRIELVAEVEPIPQRPFGFFAIDSEDPLVALANSAPPSFSPGR